MTLPQGTGNMKIRLTLLVIILTAALIPLIIYHIIFGSTPTVYSIQARQLLQKDPATILIDVRTPEEYQTRHIEKAQNWPLAQIMQLKSANALPSEFKNKTLLMICNAGVRSNTTVNYLTQLDVKQVYSVRGGIQEWVAGAGEPRSKFCIYDLWKTANNQTRESPSLQSSWFEQMITVVSGFGIKPAYTLISLLLVFILWGSKALDLACLRWAMIFFFVGENFCALNYGLYNDSSYFFEYLHSLGMLLCFSFATFAFLEGFDHRILKLSDPEDRCASLSLCGSCIKYTRVPCGLKQTFYLILPALSIIAVMPLLVPYQLNSYNTNIFGTFYNYSHSFIYQVFESRCCPITAITLLAGSFFILVFKRDNSLLAAKIIFSAAMGFLSFGFFRTVLLSLYNQNMLWFVLWEEITEFLFIGSICTVLWIFRKGLFQPKGRI